MAPDYMFRPMIAADLPLIRGWLALQHVREWWGDPEQHYRLEEATSTRDGEALLMVRNP